jgi:hypothetical protein
MNNTKEKLLLPELPLDDWSGSYATLQKVLQIVGKVKWELAPLQPRWWHVAEYISIDGFTTGTLPVRNARGWVEITFNVHTMSVDVRSDSGSITSIPLGSPVDLEAFHGELNTALTNAGAMSENVAARFKEEHEALTDESGALPFDTKMVHKFWRVMLWVDSVMTEFKGRYQGVSSPVQLFWHHMDVAHSRFARPANDQTADEVEVAFGFWAGDDTVREPAFYSYTWASPEGIDAEPLAPETAIWRDNHGSPMAFVRYHDILKEEDASAALLEFFESAYQAGARLSGFDVKGLETPQT